MFSGIVQSVGRIESVREESGGKSLQIAPNLERDWKEGESVLVSGVCSTVTAVKEGLVSFFAMPETLEKTTAGSWEKGTEVNIEPSLRLGDEVSGHFVFGHVDGRAVVEKIEAQGGSKVFAFRAPKEFQRFLVPKGSVALDGASLTVVEPTGGGFTVSFTPFTLEHTTFGKKREGEEVNLELDMLAKYAAKAWENKTPRNPTT